MAFETGGLADKLGNRYERQWIAKQLLLLLNEKNKSVLIEAIGEDEKGVDLWVETKGGERQAHQCKARNTSKEYWSINTLKSRGILGNAKLQLDRDPNCKFLLISHVGGISVLHDICESARYSNNKPEDFYKYQIIGEERKNTFTAFCNAIGLNDTQPVDQAKAIDYLKRFQIVIYSDDCNTQDDLCLLAGHLLTGEPKTNIAVLCNYAEDNYQFRKPITAHILGNYLKEQGIFLKNLTHDTRILPNIERLQTAFAASITTGMSIEPLIPREETQKLINAIKSKQHIILDGKAGYGKSGILYEFTQYLKQNNILYLPIRLDRYPIEKSTAAAFGDALGLPDSPTLCLNALVPHDHVSILILDQLDALRWTASHSETALNICKELIRQTDVYKNVVVILCCRTFDLEHDPEIKNWLLNNKKDSKSNTFERIQVKELTLEQVKNVVGSDIFVQLNEHQKELLMSVQHLTMWQQICTSGNTVDFNKFHSSTSLMKLFWENRYEVLEQQAQLSANDIENILEPLISHMETKQLISAPSSLVNKYPSQLKALQSYGILQLSENRVSFFHQTYLDYQIADRLRNQIHQGSGNILQWLGEQKDQSLFRREQLRQLLMLLAEDAPDEWLKQSQCLLEAETVRFHLKHLVLTVMGQQEKISKKLGNFCLELLEDEKWHKQAVETLCLHHKSYVLFLIEKGIINKYLDSNDEQLINQALLLLRFASEKIPDEVTDLIKLYMLKGEHWYRKILSVLCWNIENDSEKMFQLRLNLYQHNIHADWIDWVKLATQHPLRAIILLKTIVSTWKFSEDYETQRKQVVPSLYAEGETTFNNNAVQIYPEEIWHKLVPQIERLTSVNCEGHSFWIEGIIHSEYSGYQLLRTAILAGQTFAKQNPDKFINSCNALKLPISIIVQRVLIESYAALPASHADVALQWLLADEERFTLGDQYHEPPWKPAVRLIENLSPHCSDELFKQLEQTIYFYCPNDMVRIAKNALRGSREGGFRDYWGRTQYFLLPALYKEHVSSKIIDLIKVLNRKFQNYSASDFSLTATEMSRVDSKLSPSLHRISDNAWLRIVGQSDSKVPEENIFGKSVRVERKRVLSVSRELFSRSLEEIAKCFPERFGNLALRFPENVDSSYIAAIMGTISFVNPDANIPDEAREGWKPVSIETAEKVLKRFHKDENTEVAKSFCRLIEQRANENWSNSSLDRLIRYAITHSDPALDEHPQASDASISFNLSFTAINCVRGIAMSTIAEKGWKDDVFLEKVKAYLPFFVQDQHPAVRLAALEILLPLLNHDRKLAVAYFCQACENSSMIAGSEAAARFIDYTIKEYFSEIAPIIQDMLRSEHASVVECGAEYITAYWLLYDFFETELESCKMGSIAQHKGIKTAAAHFLADAQYAERCKNLLEFLLEHSDNEIRKEIQFSVLRNSFLENPEYQKFILKCIESMTFEDRFNDLIYDIKNIKGSLLRLKDIIFKAAWQLLTINGQENIHYAASELSSVLLRLYEQASEDEEIREDCLELWDRFFEQNIGSTRELLYKIES
jgi:hypothetical protein